MTEENGATIGELNKKLQREVARKTDNRSKALDILHEAQQMNGCMDVLLRGDGTFASANGMYVSPAELLQKYYKLAKQVEQAYIHLHNS